MEFYYHPFSPPSRCAWMTLEALGLEYEKKELNLFKGEHKSGEYKKINKREKVPAIKEGDFSVGESRAVAAYLVNRYGATKGKQDLYPCDPVQRAKVDQQLYVDENLWDGIFAYLNIGGILFRGEDIKHDNLDKAKASLKYYDDLLSKNKYVVSDNLTIADFFALGGVKIMELTGFNDYTDYPNIARWLKLMEALPYYEKTCNEPWTAHKALVDSKRNTGKK